VKTSSAPACHKAGQSNCRLTCICGFADAKHKAKLARKLHKKGSCVSSDRPSNFRDKTNVSVEAGVMAKLFLLQN